MANFAGTCTSDNKGLLLLLLLLLLTVLINAHNTQVHTEGGVLADQCACGPRRIDC